MNKNILVKEEESVDMKQDIPSKKLEDSLNKFHCNLCYGSYWLILANVGFLHHNHDAWRLFRIVVLYSARSRYVYILEFYDLDW